MQMTDSARTNVVPKTLLLICALTLAARFICIVYDSYVAPPPVNLVDWQPLKPIDREHANVLDKPYLLYFTASKNVADLIKCKVFENTVLKNREAAKVMKDFNCVKVQVSDKKGSLEQRLADQMYVSSTPEVLVALPNGSVVGNSRVEMSDRLFVATVQQALVDRHKAVGDAFMQRGDFKRAGPAYADYLSTGSAVAGDPSDLAICRFYIACKSVGLNQTGAQLLERHSVKGADSRSGNQCIEFFRGKVTAEDFWNRYGKDINPTSTKYFIGMKQLFDGNKSDAIKSLNWVAERGVRQNPDFANACTQLKLLGAKLPLRPEIDESDDSTYRSYWD